LQTLHEKANPPRGGDAKPTGLSLARRGGRAAERSERITKCTVVAVFSALLLGIAAVGILTVESPVAQAAGVGIVTGELTNYLKTLEIGYHRW
jgi:hypothetical protein